MYAHEPAVDAAAPTVFVVWLQACENCNVECKNLERDMVSHNSYLNLQAVWPMKIPPGASENVNTRPGTRAQFVKFLGTKIYQS